ncbi:MAG: hypothetical protein SGILL_005841, partial [Bacillariaceae sp.]
KDLRKVPKIMEDAIDCETSNDDDDDETKMFTIGDNNAPDAKRTKVQEALEQLRLSRRSQEFQGTVKILCQPEYAPKLTSLKSLNLYDCQISKLDGLGDMFSTASPVLETLNLGRNPITDIPPDFVKMQSLQHVWMDDCQLQGELPSPLMELQNLTSLRLPNNRISEVKLREKSLDAFDTEIEPQPSLKVLCLDRNALKGLPVKMNEWVPNLEELMVRHNELTDLGAETLSSSLRIVHISSNQLTSLDSLMKESNGSDGSDDVMSQSASQVPNLTHLYANANRLEKLPAGILTAHPYLQRLVVSHNTPLKEMPQEVWDKIETCDNTVGDSDEEGDDAATGESCNILWQPNPNLKKPGSDEKGGEDKEDGGEATEDVDADDAMEE